VAVAGDSESARPETRNVGLGY